MGNYHATFGNRLLIVKWGFEFHIFSWLATLWGSSLELKAPSLFALGFIFLFSANSCCGCGLKLSQEARSVILWYMECGSSLRRSNGNIIMTVGSKKAFESGGLGTVNLRKTIKPSLTPAIATCPSLIRADCTIYFTSVRYNLSNISVRKHHTPGTTASASQLKGVTKASRLLPMIIKPTSKDLILYNPSLIISISDKTLNFFGGHGGET